MQSSATPAQNGDLWYRDVDAGQAPALIGCGLVVRSLWPNVSRAPSGLSEPPKRGWSSDPDVVSETAGRMDNQRVLWTCLPDIVDDYVTKEEK